MGARADNIEVRNDVIAVVRPEPGALGQYRLYRKRRAKMSVEFVTEVEGGEVADGDEVFQQPWNVAIIEILQDPVAIERPFSVPVHIRRAKVRNRRQDIVSAVPRRSEAVVGH